MSWAAFSAAGPATDKYGLAQLTLGGAGVCQGMAVGVAVNAGKARYSGAGVDVGVIGAHQGKKVGRGVGVGKQTMLTHPPPALG